MSHEVDTSQPGRRHRYLATAAVVAATLGLITAVIGLINALADDSGGSSGNANGTTPTVSAPEGSEKGNRGEGAGAGGGKPQLDPSHDGNSRGTAKRLEANRLIEASIAAGNDQDWYVYQAPKDETATIELVEGEGELGYGGVLVTVSEGLKEIETDTVEINKSFVVRRIVAGGAQLFVSVRDLCEENGGCGLGPYTLVVGTGPPG
jgi:hypothetical protein